MQLRSVIQKLPYNQHPRATLAQFTLRQVLKAVFNLVFKTTVLASKSQKKNLKQNHLVYITSNNSIDALLNLIQQHSITPTNMDQDPIYVYKNLKISIAQNKHPIYIQFFLPYTISRLHNADHDQILDHSTKQQLQEIFRYWLYKTTRY